MSAAPLLTRINGHVNGHDAAAVASAVVRPVTEIERPVPAAPKRAKPADVEPRPLVAIPATARMPAPEFDWSPEGADARSIVFQSFRAVASYRDADGNLVIQQEREWDEDRDPVIVIPREFVEAFVQAIKTDFSELNV